MLYQGLYHHIESVGVPHLFLATGHCVSCVMGLQDGKTFKPTICVEFSRASLYAFFCCCSIFLRVLSVSVFSLASRCPQFSVLYLGVPQDWVSLSLDTECFHFGAFYVACGILWPKETFLWQQIRARLHQETSVTPSAELNCDHH